MAEPVGPEVPTPTPHQAWAKTTLWVLVMLIVAVNTLLFLRSCQKVPGDVIDKTGKLVRNASRLLADVAGAFNQGRVTTEFISYASSLSPTHRLQFATLKQTEIFTRTDAASTGFGYVPLPDIVVEARAPVEFTYYLDLNARWQLLLQDNVIYVLAPDIQFNQPAVDASAIRYEVKKDSVIRDTKAALENLKQSVTQLSKIRARENINLVRETGRRQTEEFVEKWLMKTFSDAKQYPVKVYFPGEKLPAGIQAEAGGAAPVLKPPQ